MTISFSVSKDDAGTIREIVDRAYEYNGEKDRVSLSMDITATHANGCPLKLSELLATDRFNFSHDVFGIARHIDRTTGHLLDCFWPRFAVKPEM